MVGPESQISFAHIWKFGINPVFGARDRESFTTSHNCALFEWNVNLLSEDLFALPRMARNSQIRISLESSIRTWHIRVPEVIQCTFQMIIRNEQTAEVLLSPPSYTMRPSQNMGHLSLAVPSSSPLGTAARDLWTNPQYIGQTCEICTTLVQPLSSYDIGDWPLAAPPLPLQLDFRFNSAFDRSRHDFTIVTRGGIPYPANREALFLSSGFFRRRMPLSDSRTTEIAVDLPYDVVHTVVVFMLTGTFSAPPSLSPTSMKEIVDTAARFCAIDRNNLHNALEKMAAHQLIDHRDDLDVVVQWLLAGSDCDMARLQNGASALLVTEHFDQFVNDYNSTATSPALSEVRDRLHLRRGVFRPAPYGRLMQLKRDSLNVRTIVHMKSEESTTS